MCLCFLYGIKTRLIIELIQKSNWLSLRPTAQSGRLRFQVRSELQRGKCLTIQKFSKDLMLLLKITSQKFSKDLTLFKRFNVFVEDHESWMIFHPFAKLNYHRGLLKPSMPFSYSSCIILMHTKSPFMYHCGRWLASIS